MLVSAASGSLAPVAVGKVVHLFPDASAAASSRSVSFGPQARAHGPPGLLPEPPGASGVSFPQAQRRKHGHLPKAKAGCGYQRREADAGAKTTDVCFETRLFRCNLSPKNNRREHTHEAPAGLWGDRIWADLWLPPRRAPWWPGLGSPLLTAQGLRVPRRQEGRREEEGREGEREGP